MLASRIKAKRQTTSAPCSRPAQWGRKTTTNRRRQKPSSLPTMWQARGRKWCPANCRTVQRVFYSSSTKLTHNRGTAPTEGNSMPHHAIIHKGRTPIFRWRLCVPILACFHLKVYRHNRGSRCSRKCATAARSLVCCAPHTAN